MDDRLNNTHNAFFFSFSFTSFFSGKAYLSLSDEG